MPARGKIAMLPADVRERLEARLIGQGFSGYTEISEWLAGEGYQISRSSLHRHGDQLERRIAQIEASTQAAEALMARTDDKASLAAASIKAAQSQLFDFMMALEGGDPKEIALCARAVADLARATVTIRRERERTLADAQKAVEGEIKRRGISGDFAAGLLEALRMVPT